MNRHIQTHKGSNKEFGCPLCGKLYSIRKSVKRHLKQKKCMRSLQARQAKFSDPLQNLQFLSVHFRQQEKPTFDEYSEMNDNSVTVTESDTVTEHSNSEPEMQLLQTL